MRITLLSVILVCWFSGCVDYTSDLCIPHVDTHCQDGANHWLDSCDRVENILEECECGCRADGSACRKCGEKECETNQDCPKDYWCDRTVWQCKPVECVPDCTNKCCGPDGCGNDCPDNCPRGYECNQHICLCEPTGGCVSDANCLPYQCCKANTCVEMDCGPLMCGPDPVCGKECGECPPEYFCENGVCVVFGGLCPAGQECMEVSAEGLLGCIIPPNTVPPENQIGCTTTPCVGNFHCAYFSETETICIEHCGTCPWGTECCQLWQDGPMGCLAPGCTGLPPNPSNCPCQGNSNCYTDGATDFCIHNCSSHQGPCTPGERRCQGDVVQECEYGSWVDLMDCSRMNQMCSQGACTGAPGLGEFCEDLGECQPGLDCIGTAEAQHFFCTPRCNCQTGAGCYDGWECMFPYDADLCWCGKPCLAASDCPNGGTGWECIYIGQNEQGNAIYGCLPR